MCPCFRNLCFTFVTQGMHSDNVVMYSSEGARFDILERAGWAEGALGNGSIGNHGPSSLGHFFAMMSAISSQRSVGYSAARVVREPSSFTCGFLHRHGL